ncbi:hypothetical protein WG66_004377 [Moniliophthora roreri]|nr:hypothetical protein WG66_004377 [Moniliophthora roreri]
MQVPLDGDEQRRGSSKRRRNQSDGSLCHVFNIDTRLKLAKNYRGC